MFGENVTYVRVNFSQYMKNSYKVINKRQTMNLKLNKKYEKANLFVFREAQNRRKWNIVSTRYICNIQKNGQSDSDVEIT